MEVSHKKLRKRRASFAAFLFMLFSIVGFVGYISQPASETVHDSVLSSQTDTELAATVLDRLEVKGRAPKTGYARDEFGSGWASIEGCDMRNIILQRSLRQIELSDDDCIVLSGVLDDPYTGEIIMFTRGRSTSDDVQIDHVVALSDAWQKGAQDLDFSKRVVFANDPLNLLAVDGSANQQKGDSDAASWLPENKSYRCQYVARQIAVKDSYELWVTEAEYTAMKRTLNGCGEQRVPLVEYNS